MRAVYRHFSRRLLERHGVRIGLDDYAHLCEHVQAQLPHLPVWPTKGGRLQIAILYAGTILRVIYCPETLRVIYCPETHVLVTVLPPLPTVNDRMEYARRTGHAYHWSKRHGRKPYQRHSKYRRDE